MPRTELVTDREALPAESREAFDSIVATRGGMPAPFAVMMDCPEVAGRIAHLGAYLRFESSLPAAVSELAIMIATREFDCAAEWGGHVALAKREGVSDATVAAVANFGAVDGLPDEDAEVIRFGRELLADHQVADESYDAMLKRYGAQGVIELSGTLGYYALMSTVLNAVGLEGREGAEPLPAR